MSFTLSYDRQSTSKSPNRTRFQSPGASRLIPSTLTGRMKLFRDIASPEHKQTNSKLSFKNLTSSIAELRAVASVREPAEKLPKIQQALTPKVSMRVRHHHTHSGQEFLIRSQETEFTAEKSPERVEQQTQPEEAPEGVEQILLQDENTQNTQGEAVEPVEEPMQGALTPKINLAERRGYEVGSPKGNRDRRELSPLQTDTFVFRDQMVKDYEASPMIRVDEEALYYDTIRNLDVCGKCWTDCQKLYSSPFKLKNNIPKTTTYQKEFVSHPQPEKPIVLTGNDYETYHSNHIVSLGTTMRNDYKPWATSYVRHEGPKQTLGPDDSPCYGRTTYNTEFLNYKAPKGPVQRQPQHKTALTELPFTGKSTYSEAFADSGKPRKFVTRWPKRIAKSPLPTGAPFLAETTTGSAYKPFKVKPGSRYKADNEEYFPSKSFANQFKSSYQRDFEIRPKAPCPAKLFIEHYPPPRANFFEA